MFTERVLHPRCPLPRTDTGEGNAMVPEHSPFPPAFLTNLRCLPPPRRASPAPGPCWQQAISWLVPCPRGLYRDNMITGMFQPLFYVHAMPWVVCEGQSQQHSLFHDHQRGGQFLCPGRNKSGVVAVANGLMRALAGGGRPVASTGKGH